MAGNLYTKREVIIEGTGYFNFKNSTGVYEGWGSGASIDTLAFTIETEVQKCMIKDRGQYMQTFASVTRPTNINFTMNLKAMNADMTAKFFLGEASLVNVTGASITNEAITTVAYPLWSELANKHINATGIVVTDVAGTTTYSATTDYEIDRRNGFIRLRTGGAITAGTVVHVDYTYDNMNGEKIKGVTQSVHTCKIRIDGYNRVEKRDCFIEIFQADIRPSGAKDFFNPEFSTYDFSGEMITPSGYDHPFKLEYVDLQA